MLNYGWQHDPQLWAKVPIDLRDSSAWRSVGFVEKESVLVPADKSGVYFFCTSPAGRRIAASVRSNDLFSRLFTPIYIGKTDNLQRRFLEHCRTPSAKLRDARRCFGASIQFWFHRVVVDRLRADEAILIRCFGPTANEKKESIIGVLGKPVPIGIQD